MLAERGERNWRQFVEHIIQAPEITQVTICSPAGSVDTVLFDKTGMLTRDRPEVGRMIASDSFTPERILGFTAVVERKFHFRISLAILRKAQKLGLKLPPTDDTLYKVGYGITVGGMGHAVRVGGKRFMDSEGVAIKPEVAAALEQAHVEGHTMVMVSVNGRLGGALELHAAVKPEVRQTVQGLRDHGILPYKRSLRSKPKNAISKN